MPWRKKNKQRSCLRYLCLFTYNGVQHILCCCFFVFFSSSCIHYIASFSALFSRVYYLQNIVENLKIELHEPHRKLGVNQDAPEGQEVPIPLVIHVNSIGQWYVGFLIQLGRKMFLSWRTVL